MEIRIIDTFLLFALYKGSYKNRGGQMKHKVKIGIE